MTRRFSASSAAQLMACPGSANLELAIPGFVQPPRQPAKARDSGTAVHELLEVGATLTTLELVQRAGKLGQFQQLHHTKRAATLKDLSTFASWYGGIPLGRVSGAAGLYAWFVQANELTPKLMRFVAEALSYVADLRVSFNEPPVAWGEKTLQALFLKQKTQTTPDLVLISQDGRIVDVVDYKSGVLPVSPVENDQLLFYAACVVYEWALTPLLKDAKFRLHIVQPGNIDVPWETTGAHVAEWIKEAREAERKILNGDLTLRPTDHCTFCPANPHGRGEKGRPYCPAMMQKLYPQYVDEVDIYEGL